MVGDEKDGGGRTDVGRWWRPRGWWRRWRKIRAGDGDDGAAVVVATMVERATVVVVVTTEEDPCRWWRRWWSRRSWWRRWTILADGHDDEGRSCFRK